MPVYAAHILTILTPRRSGIPVKAYEDVLLIVSGSESTAMRLSQEHGMLRAENLGDVYLDSEEFGRVECDPEFLGARDIVTADSDIVFETIGSMFDEVCAELTYLELEFESRESAIEWFRKRPPRPILIRP